MINPQVPQLSHAEKEKAIVQRLANRLKETPFFPAGAQHTRLLALYVQNYDGAPTLERLKEAAGGHDPTKAIAMLNKQLKTCFCEERSLWFEQSRLFVPHKQRNEAHPPISVQPLYEILEHPTDRFWFTQCCKLSDEPSPDPIKNTFILFSEPLFFYSREFRGYFRLLDLNFEEQFTADASTVLVEEAKERIRSRFPAIADAANEELRKYLNKLDATKKTKKKTSSALIDKFLPLEIEIKKRVAQEMDTFVNGLGLVAVRTYIPAGDSYGAVAIRRWFRERMNAIISYRESHVSDGHLRQANLIILASRSTLPLLADFQKEESLAIKLTQTGIEFSDTSSAIGTKFNKMMIDDEIDTAGNIKKAHVVVTMWRLDTENVYTFIASNHTRAVEAVAKLLVNDEILRKQGAAIIHQDRIPSRFQLAFEVPLIRQETHANEPKLLPQLKGQAVRYPEPQLDDGI